MKPKSPQQKGYTLVEILIVLTMLVFVAGFIVIGFRNYASYQQFNQAAGDVDFTLKQTRLNARSALVDQPHGVHFSTDSVTQFYGDTYDVADPTNQVIQYELVTIDPTLTGGVDTIVFSKLTGLPSATGTVVISGTRFSASTTINISDTGVIQ